MKRTLFVMLVAALLLAACAPGRAPEQEVYLAEPLIGGAAPPPAAEAPADAFAAEDRATAGGVEAAAVERLVIKNADLSIVVPDPAATMTAIQVMADRMGGWVVSSNLYQTYTINGVKVPEAAIVVRVPDEKLDEALEEIKAGAVEVQSETISGQDVTAEYVDLESRLRAHEDAAEQLTVILEEKTTPEEVLEVFNQIVYHREQIELIQGQMRYYEEAAAMSAISVRIIAEETIQPLEIGGWTPQGTAREAIQDLIFFLQGFADFMILFVLNFLPKLLMIGLVFGVPIWLIVRAVVRRSRRKKSAAPQEAAKA